MMTTHRYICEMLEEMRTAIKVGRIDMLLGLIEEAQTAANRMEAKLHEYSGMGYDLEKGREYAKKLKSIAKAIDELEEEIIE